MNWFSAVALVGQGGAAAPGGGGTSYMLMMFAVLAIFFYFIILRPQQREQKRQQKVLDAVKKGDQVESIGGIHGTVVAVDTTHNIVSVQVDKNVKLDFSRNAIKSVFRKEDAKAAAAGE
ncbi:preprotein translocase subunit YajC [candidate division BRC1 bacterium HGW-BRC1-1]|jgi:preprotein translocase subunit YajC|nr:MAG: preprotein translocase subunit YajC [candidate division BRC1 bacterium HGW-BRC1-1]